MKEETQAAFGLSRRGVMLGAIGAMAAPALARAATMAGDGSWAAVTARAEAMIAGKDTPGLQLAVVKKGAMVYSRGFGFANLETGTAVGPTTIFRIGSVTKQFTAAALMQMQEAGLLSVDDKLAKFLPDFPRANEVSLRQMLTHTSGIGSYTDTKEVATFLQRSRTDYPPAALYEAMKSSTDPAYIGEPGAQYRYSNTAYVLLGLVIEKVGGKPYAEIFKSNLFDRAGLIRTAVDDNAEVVRGRASGYSASAAAPSGFENASYISMTYPGAAGSIRSTSEDMCRWHQALFAGRVVSAASLKEMITPGRLANGQLPTAGRPGATRTINYGMGLGMETDARGRMVAHGGGIQGGGGWVGSYPDAGIHIGLAINGDAGYDGKSKLGASIQELREEIFKAVFA